MKKIKETVGSWFAILCILATFLICCAPDASKAWYTIWGIIAAVSLVASLYLREEDKI